VPFPTHRTPSAGIEGHRPFFLLVSSLPLLAFFSPTFICARQDKGFLSVPLFSDEPCGYHSISPALALFSAPVSVPFASPPLFFLSGEVSPTLRSQVGRRHLPFFRQYPFFPDYLLTLSFPYCCRLSFSVLPFVARPTSFPPYSLVFF